MKKASLIFYFVLWALNGIGQNHSDSRLIVSDYPKAEMPKDIETVYIKVYLNGDPISCSGIAVVLYGKGPKGTFLLDSVLANIVYNQKKSPKAEYKDGEIHIISGMPMNEAESVAKFKLMENKLIFIVNDIIDPNADLYAEIEEALKNGDIKLAGELAFGVQSPPFGYLESLQMTLLLRAHEVAMEFSKKKDYKNAAITIGYAYDFFNGINEESDIKPDSKEAKAIADYTYFLLNIKDYKKCIDVSKVVIKLSPGLAGPYLHMGNSLFATDEKEEAKKPYEKYIEIRKSKNEENRIPAYVYERLNIGKPIMDTPEVIVYKLFKWYFDNKINELELTNWNDPNMKFYRVNFTATEKYLQKLETTSFVSKTYIENWRNYFKKCDETLIKEKQNDGPPIGFEFDFITNSQEKPEKINTSDFKLVEIKGNKAKVNYAGYLVYLLQLEGNEWKITGIENNEN